MAHYAIISSENDTVTQVITGVDETVTQTDTDGTEVGGSTEAWEEFYAAMPQFSGCYVRRTSYNGNFRKNYAGIGYTFDAGRDAFIAPKPFESWLLDEATCRWEAPVPYPTDGALYSWNESTVNWEEVAS
jgi:hypothetical protein